MDVCRGLFPLPDLQVTDRKCWTFYPIRFNCDNHVFVACVCFPWRLFRIHTERVAGGEGHHHCRNLRRVQLVFHSSRAASSIFTAALRRLRRIKTSI